GEVPGVLEGAVAEAAAEFAEPVGLLGEPGVDRGDVGELEGGAGVGAPPALLVVAGGAELVEPQLDVLEGGRRAALAVAHAEDEGGDALDGGVADDGDARAGGGALGRARARVRLVEGDRG